MAKRAFSFSRRGFLAGLLGGAATAGLGAPTWARAPARAAFGEFGLDLAGMDKTVRPGDDFYSYANGGWARDIALAPDKGDTGAFDRLNDDNLDRIRHLLEQAATSPDPEVRKLNTFYANYLDEAKIEALGMTPLEADFLSIGDVTSPVDLARSLGKLLVETGLGPIGLGVGVTSKHPDRSVAHLGQGPLILATREAYLGVTPEQVALQTFYRNSCVKLMTLGGLEEAPFRTAHVWSLERRLAEAQLPREKTRRGAETPMNVWQDYLRLRRLQGFAPVGPKPFPDESSALARRLTGAEATRERWKRAVDRVNATLGDGVGRLFIEAHFTPEARAQVTTMVAEVRAAFRARVAALPWLEKKTIRTAVAKLDALKIEIGRPDVWRDYTDLEVRPGDAYGDRIRGVRFAYRQTFAKLGKPVDRGEWPPMLLPQTVNAMSNPMLVKLMIPAGILQPPFFDAAAEPAVNYGAIGHIIGHEISHHLDNTGAGLDETGRGRMWWSIGDLFQFPAAQVRLQQQVEAYEVFPGVSIDGKRTSGENISDLGGLCVAYDAYRAHLNGKSSPELAGLTGDQRFFLGFAQVYRRQTREPLARTMLAIDSHAPARFRVATVRNIDAWYEAFNVQPGDKLYLPPKQRVRIW